MAVHLRRGRIAACRFITSIVVGFYLGTYIISHFGQPLQRVMCSPPPYSRVRVTERDTGTITRTRQPPQNGILYIGVMSMNLNLDSRAAALLDTWGRHPNVKLEIFSTCNETSRKVASKCGAQIISLPGVVDISYPPQKKSFSMLKYIHDNHLENFDWFLRADDDAYVKTEDLLQFLSKVNASKPLIIGQPGYGKHKEDHLFGENYCIGGTGVLLSRALLRKVGPKLSTCLQQLYTEHEDIELGRCVRRVTGINCITAWEASTIFYQNYGPDQRENIKSISERKRADALTFHANKDPIHQYRLHMSILFDRVGSNHDKISRMEGEVTKMRNVFETSLFDLKKDKNTYTGDMSKAITGKSVFSLKDTVRPTSHAEMGAVSQAILYGVSSELRQRDGIFNSQIRDIILKNGTTVIAPLISEDLIANVQVQMVSKYIKDYVKHVHLRRTFLKSHIYLEEPQSLVVTNETNNVGLTTLGLSGQSTRIHFIVVVIDRNQPLKRFLRKFDEAHLRGENISLTLVNYKVNGTRVTSNVDEHSNHDVHMFVRSSLRRYPNLPVKMLSVNSQASFSMELESAFLANGIDEDEILFFCDVNAIFTAEFFNNVRRNTIQGRQAFNPIAFSQYDPETVHFYQTDSRYNPLYNFDIGFGFWRRFGCETLTIYKSDFMKTARSDSTVWDWLRQPDKLCKAASKHPMMQIFTANEPGLAYIYPDKECPEHFHQNQQKSCRGTKAEYFEDKPFLHDIIRARNSDT